MKEHKYIEELPEIIDHFASEDILPPWSMDLEVTSRCNLRCAMCPKKMGLEPNPSNTDISWETFKNAEKAFPELNRMNLNGFGESFLHPDFLDMVREINKYQIYANITTNGLLIKKEMVKDLVQSGIYNVSFSLDSIDPETFKLIRGTNKLDKILENIKLLLKTKEELGSRLPYVGLSFVAMSVNIEHLPEVLEFARKHCLNSVSICPFDDYQDRFGYSMTNCLEKARDSFIKARNIAIQHNMNVNFNFETDLIVALKRRNPKDEFFNLFHRFIPAYKSVYNLDEKKSKAPYKKYCDFPFYNIVISSEGNVLPCCKCTPNYKMGNINEKPLIEIWRGQKFRNFRRKLLSFDPPDICVNCSTADWKPWRHISRMTDHFDSSYHDDTQMGRGFYQPVYDYSKKYWWTRKEASLFLQYNKQNYLQINAGSLLGKEVENNRNVEVFINDNYTGSFPLKYRFRNYLLPVKGCDGNVAKISFKIDKTIKPCDNGIIDDKRKLGLALSRVEFVDGSFKTLFFTSGTDTSHLLDGWSGAETWGAWTDKLESSIKVAIEPGRSYRMVFYVCPYFDSQQQQSLQVFFEDTLLGEIEFEKGNKDWQAYNLLLPAKLITKTSHIMRFKSAYVISPYEITKGEVIDHRTLGVGFKLIKFSM